MMRSLGGPRRPAPIGHDPFAGNNRMYRQDDRELREQLAKLKTAHQALDDEIAALEASGTADQLLIKRLKKKKLMVKDQITLIEDRLLPDIIA